MTVTWNNVEADRDAARTRGRRRPLRVLIPFGTPFLYGMERGVIEIFDTLRPEIEPQFVQSRAIFERRPPVIEELERRRLALSLLPDRRGWPRLGKPTSLRHFSALVAAFVKGNLYYASRARKTDALYVTSVNGALLNFLAAVYCRLTKRPVIHHFHDLGNDRRLLSIWAPLATDFIHNTELGRQVVGRSFPRIARKRNVVLPCIVDGHVASETNDVRAEIGSGRHIVYLGQVSEHKGVDLLLEAFRRIAHRSPDAVLDIVGGCAPEFEDRFKTLCGEADLAGRVKHWGYRNDGARLLRGAYLYVHPSPPSRVHESFGRSVVEAMSAGLPVVCFRSGALQEIVQHEKTGLVCEEDVGALAEALDRMLGDTAVRDACAAASLRRYQECYSPAVVRPRWLAFFDGMRPQT